MPSYKFHKHIISSSETAKYIYVIHTYSTAVLLIQNMYLVCMYLVICIHDGIHIVCILLTLITRAITILMKRTPELLLGRIFAKSHFFIIRDRIFLLKYQLTALMLGVIVTLKVFP